LTAIGYAVTSDTRLTMASNIPTFAEMGPSALSYTEWAGLFAPKGTSRDIIAKLNAVAVAALTDPVIKARIEEFGPETLPRERQTPEDLAAMVKIDAEKWWPIFKEHPEPKAIVHRRMSKKSLPEKLSRSQW
jgi:tripartite-type tricarboxylate transporter receptor subunit TctC